MEDILQQQATNYLLDILNAVHANRVQRSASKAMVGAVEDESCHSKVIWDKHRKGLEHNVGQLMCCNAKTTEVFAAKAFSKLWTASSNVLLSSCLVAFEVYLCSAATMAVSLCKLYMSCQKIFVFGGGKSLFG